MLNETASHLLGGFVFAYNYRSFLQRHPQMENAEYFPPLLKASTQSRSNIIAQCCYLFEFTHFVMTCNINFSCFLNWKCFRDSRTGPLSDSKFGEVNDLIHSHIGLNCVLWLIVLKVVIEMYICFLGWHTCAVTAWK